MSVTIGIDFGTSFCSASWINPATGKPDAIRFKDTNSEKLPSIIHVDKHNNIQVGRVAAYALEEDAEGVFFTSIKMHLDKRNKWLPQQYTDADLISFILKKVREDVVKSCSISGTIDKVVLTHPVWNDATDGWKKDLLKHAAALAGFKKVKLLTEPEAAAFYAIKAGIVPETCKGLLVYDFGGGTFDVSYVQVFSDGQLKTPVLPQGDPQCGGDDIDRALYAIWDKFILANKQKSISPEPGEINEAFMYSCRRQKEQMSMGGVSTELSKYIPTIGRVTMPFTRKDFDKLVNPFIDRTLAKTKIVLDDIRAKGLPLTHVVLIGGSSNLPQVEPKLQELVGKNVTLRPTGQNDIAVAVGALYSLDIKIEPPKKTEPSKPTQTPTPPKQHPKECFCIHCGKKIMTSHKVCMYCGKPNFSYKP